MKKELAKIESVSFGLGGYQGAMIGLHLVFSGKGWGVSTDHCFWDFEQIKWSEHCKWNETDRAEQCIELVKLISETLEKAKVQSVHQLKGIPVEVTFDDRRTLTSWRILEEVL